MYIMVLLVLILYI